MNTAILIAALLAFATAIVTAAPYADAAYIAPDATWQAKAFCLSGC